MFSGVPKKLMRGLLKTDRLCRSMRRLIHSTRQDATKSAIHGDERPSDPSIPTLSDESPSDDDHESASGADEREEEASEQWAWTQIATIAGVVLLVSITIYIFVRRRRAPAVSVAQLQAARRSHRLAKRQQKALFVTR